MTNITATGGPFSVSTDAGTYRQCTIEIKNDSNYTFSNPRMYIKNGNCSYPFPPTIEPHTCATAVFSKTPYSLWGCAGVITYDLHDNDTKQVTEKMAVMFTVPYSDMFEKNWYAVGVFGKNTVCDYDLYDEMYQKSGKRFVKGHADDSCLTHEGGGILIMATMSNAAVAAIRMQVQNKSK